MRYDQRTRAYVRRRITEGIRKQEILRCLKRYSSTTSTPHAPTSPPSPLGLHGSIGMAGIAG